MRTNEPRSSRWRGIAITAIGLVLPFQGGCACGCGAGLVRGGPGRETGPVCQAVLGAPPPANNIPPPAASGSGSVPPSAGDQRQGV